MEYRMGLINEPPLCYRWLDIHSAEAARLTSAIAQEADHRHAARYRDDGKALASLTARVLLRQLLAESTQQPPDEWQLWYDEGGRPWASHPSIQAPYFVSLSHSGSVAAAACSCDHPVGIDIEVVLQRRSWRALREYLFPDFSEAIADSLGFHRAWCLYEAWLKIHEGSIWNRDLSTEFRQLLEGLLSGHKRESGWVVEEWRPGTGMVGLVIQKQTPDGGNTPSDPREDLLPGAPMNVYTM